MQKTPHPAALLVSVADTYDALRTSRSYQDPRTTPEALSILIREANAGRVHKLFVSVFARMLEVVTPGRVVKLSDGRSAQVLSEGEYDALTPLVETEEMEILDLSMPDAPELEVIDNKIL
jgi:HD-GYP domain-containing protein (c-di-GMP phosphodiesterase class II)